MTGVSSEATRKWADRYGRHLAELTEHYENSRSWRPTPIVLRNITDLELELVREECSWGRWSTANGVSLTPFRNVSPNSIVWFAAENSPWRPTGTYGYLVYGVPARDLEICVVFSNPSLGRASIGVVAAKAGFDWASEWEAGRVQTALSTSGSGPTLVGKGGVLEPPSAGVMYVTVYKSAEGPEFAIVLEPPEYSLPDPSKPTTESRSKKGPVKDESFYTLLGVASNATDAEIKRGYRQAALRCHPDKNPGDLEAEKRFKEIARAYEVLRDPSKRKDYDMRGKEGIEAGNEAMMMKASLDALFGHGALEEDIGELDLLRTLDPEHLREKFMKTVDQLDQESVARENSRVLALLVRLDDRLQGYVDNERRWHQTMTAKLQEKAQSSPGIGELIRTIGYVYQQTARQNLSRCCGLQALLEYHKEACNECGRGCALIGKLFKMSWLQAWAGEWQARMDDMTGLADRLRENSPPVDPMEVHMLIRRLKKCNEDIPKEVFDLIEGAAKKATAGDHLGAAADLETAVANQRDHIQEELRRKMEVLGLGYLFAEGSNEVDHIARRTANLLVKSVRGLRCQSAEGYTASTPRSVPQANRMISALEILGRTYMTWGEKEFQEMDFGDVRANMRKD